MATRYALPTPYFYIDKAAAAQYEAQGGDEIVASHTFNAPAGVVLDAWLQHVWVNGHGAQELQPGEGRGLVNHERFIPHLQSAEQIKSAGLPSDDDSDASGAVSSILYMITKAAALPFTNHIALVRFIQDETKHTEVVWTTKMTFAAGGVDSAKSMAKVAESLTASLVGLAEKIETP